VAEERRKEGKDAGQSELFHTETIMAISHEDKLSMDLLREIRQRFEVKRGEQARFPSIELPYLHTEGAAGDPAAAGSSAGSPVLGALGLWGSKEWGARGLGEGRWLYAVQIQTQRDRWGMLRQLGPCCGSWGLLRQFGLVVAVRARARGETQPLCCTYTLHPTPYTQHPTPYTLYPTSTRWRHLASNKVHTLVHAEMYSHHTKEGWTFKTTNLLPPSSCAVGGCDGGSLTTRRQHGGNKTSFSCANWESNEMSAPQW
jgi:hypothetical protein